MAVFLFFLTFVIPGPHFAQASGKQNSKETFDPESVNIESVENDEEFARLLPEYSMRFTGLVDREMETAFSTIVSELSGEVEEKVFRGTRSDGESIELEYTGIDVMDLLKERIIGQEVHTVVVYGSDKYAAAIPFDDFSQGEVWLVWKKQGSYMVPSQDGVLKIVQNEGLTRNWVKNPVLFEFIADFYDKVPAADRLKKNEIDFVSQQDMFTLSIGGAPEIHEKDWSLSVKGLVENAMLFSYAELLNMPQVSVYATLETISNPPGGRLIGNAVWTGVPLHFIFQAVGPTPETQEVVFRCADGYSTSITVEEALEEGVMLALKMNGEKLEGEHGYPVRVVVPDKYGMKWAKWITEIEFVDYDYRGFWEKRGWSDYAGRDRPDKRYD